MYFEVWFNGIKVNVMWLGENECVWWVKWKLWLMVSCGFFLKKVKRTIGRETGIRQEASGIER